MKSVFLSGFMGTGKSTLGPLVGSRLGLPFVDTDVLVASRAGRPVAELVRTDEKAFRALEREVVAELVAGPPHVVAVGGGAFVSNESRRAALEAGVVVTLSADVETLVRRTQSRVHERPLLEGDVEGRIRELLEARASVYAECHGTVHTDALELDACEDAIYAIVKENPLLVPLGQRSYRVHVVDDAPNVLTDVVAGLGPSGILAVTDSHVVRARGPALEKALGAIAAPHRTCTLAPGEEHKTLSTVDTLWEAAIGQGLDRDGLFVAFGGGVVGDLTGFAAATLYRGVRAVQVPTTLLAMVDASVGGKTGFDLPSGKNLVGAFFQPSAVVADVAHLSTLPVRHRRAGLAEVLKVALLFDAGLVDDLLRLGPALVSGPPSELLDVVRRAIAWKARVVARDETEKGERALLNFGHTVGHALESHGRYTSHLHGEAVAMGMVAELELARARGWVGPEVVATCREVLGRFGLPTDATRSERSGAVPFLEVDKKRKGGKVVLPFASEIGRGRLESVSTAELGVFLRGAG